MPLENQIKLEKLARIEGYPSEITMLEDNIGGVVVGICTNPDCNYTTEVEPDSDSGWCENCETNTVSSCLMLAGLI